MRPTARSHGRARALLVATCLTLSAGLALMPDYPSAVIALGADLADPSASPEPTADPSALPGPSPTPTVDPTPSPPDPTPTPEPSPTPDPSASADPTPDPTPTPSPTPTPTPTPSPTPLPPGVIGPDGGIVTGGDVTLVVPPGAVVDPTRISIVPVPVPEQGSGLSLYGFLLTAEDDASGATVSLFGLPLTLVVDAAGWDLVGVDGAHLTIAELSDGAWSTIATGSVGSLTATTDHVGTFAVLGQFLPAAVDVDQRSDAPERGRHRVEPGSVVRVTASVRPSSRLDRGLLVETIPAGWRVIDTGGGRFDPQASTVSWPLRSLSAGATAERSVRAQAPSVPFEEQLAVPSTFSVRVEQGSARTDGPDLAVLVAPRVVVAHVTAGRVAGPDADAAYLAADEPLTGEPRFQVFRLRFDVRNADSLPVRWAPRLEFRPALGGAFIALPAGENVAGVPFYAAPEWLREADRGTRIGPSSAPLVASEIGAERDDGPDHAPVDGIRAMGLNPLPEVELPPLSRSVVEFSVRATADAVYLESYAFRVTDGGEPFLGAAEALVSLGPTPPLELSPGQRLGVPVGERAQAVQTPVRFSLGVGAADLTPGDRPGGDQTPVRFVLIASVGAAASSALVRAASALALGPEPIHGPTYGLATDACAACHRSHEAPATLLRASPPPQLGLCGSCHDGVSASDVQAAYTAAPTNDPADRAYFRHEPSELAGHASDGDDALAGQLNRHNECADCHNPHNARSSSSANGSSGWTASGRVAGASSVTVTNGAAGFAPAYARASTTALEYELCLKCHAGYTQLPSNEGLPPSRFALDKGIEFNPANLSYHPVEAPGRNSSPAMAYSLSGTSPFKQWQLTPASTIRCVNCHADSRLLASSGSDGGPIPADSSLPVHASVNRGILIAGYLDRQLKNPLGAYEASNFALCFLCHAEAPFRDTTGDERLDTSFRYHGLHVSGDNLRDHGSGGTDIDAAGDGGGLASCAACHFRIHSTAFAVNGQPPGSRLVNFAPNVMPPTGGTLSWQQKTDAQDGSCTLKCHGQPHDKSY